MLAKIPEKEFIMIAQQCLELELRKKFEGTKFNDIQELGIKASRYENLLKEEIERKVLIMEPIIKKHWIQMSMQHNSSIENL